MAPLIFFAKNCAQKQEVIIVRLNAYFNSNSDKRTVDFKKQTA